MFSELLDFVLELPAEFSSGTDDEDEVLSDEDSSELSSEITLVRDLRKPRILILAIFSAKREGEDFDCADIVRKEKEVTEVLLCMTQSRIVRQNRQRDTKEASRVRSATTQYHGS